MRITVCGFSKRGGMHHYPIQLANGLSSHENVSLVLPSGGDATEYVSDNINIFTYDIPSFDTKIGKTKAGTEMYVNIYKIVKSTNPDIIHHSFIGPTKSTLILPFFRLLSVPIVSTLHDPILVVGDGIKTKDKRQYVMKNRLAGMISDKVLVHGKSTLNQAIGAGYNIENFEIIPHGKYDLFKRYDYKKHNTENNTLLFFGSIRSDKGFDRIPRILDRVEERVPNISAIVAGKPSEGKSSLIDTLRDDPRVELHAEYIPNEIVGEYFTRAAVVVLPYHRATSSGVLMTSYTFEKPVVATNVGDLAEMISQDDAGIVANQNNIDDISESIIKLLTNKKLYKNKKQNMKSAAEKYLWDVLAEQLIDLYSSF